MAGITNPPNAQPITQEMPTRPWAVWFQNIVDNLNFKDAILDTQIYSTNQAAVTFVNGFGAQYTNYKITLINVTFSAATTLLQLLVSTNGGSSYITGAGSYMWGLASILYSGAATTYANSTSDTAIHLNSVNCTNTAHNVLNGTITIFNPQNGSQYTMMKWDLSYNNTTPDLVQVQGTASYLANTAINGFKLLPTSGNIASGRFVVTGFN